jgi:hypothetical protein
MPLAAISCISASLYPTHVETSSDCPSIRTRFSSGLRGYPAARSTLAERRSVRSHLPHLLDWYLRLSCLSDCSPCDKLYDLYEFLVRHPKWGHHPVSVDSTRVGITPSIAHISMTCNCTGSLNRSRSFGLSWQISMPTWQYEAFRRIQWREDCFVA